MRYFLFAMAALFAGYSVQATALTRTDVEKIVEEYIAENGQALAMSIEKYLADEQRNRTNAMIYDHTLSTGPENAKVVFIEFSDFECPFCARAQGTVQKLREEYKGKVRFVLKHLPLDAIHPNAIPAAVATQAAAAQNKGWEFAESLWKNQDKLSEKLYLEIAKDLKLDMKKFESDLASEEITAQVTQDMKDAASLGARGTPYFSINGEGVSGAQPFAQFKTLIDQLLEE